MLALASLFAGCSALASLQWLRWTLTSCGKAQRRSGCTDLAQQRGRASRPADLVHIHTSTITAVVSRRRDMFARDGSLCVKHTCSTNRVMYTPLLGLWESGRGGRVSSTTRSDAARPRRRGQPTYRAGRQSSALEQEDVIAVLGLPSSRPGGPGLGRWPATTMTGTRPSGRWAPRREPRVPHRLQNQCRTCSHYCQRGVAADCSPRRRWKPRLTRSTR